MNYDRLKQMAANVKLVISDMDGTLLDSGKHITERTRTAIRGLEEQGIGFTICTGRIPAMIQYYVKTLDINIPVVAANGAIVWDPVSEETLYDKPIDWDQAMELMDFCRFHHMDYSALTLESGYFSDNSIRIEKFRAYNAIAEENGEKPMKLQYIGTDHGFLSNKKVYKMLIYEVAPGQMESAERFIKNLPGIECTSSDAGLLDLSAAGVVKGTGLKKAAEIMGIEQKEICAFGDFYNDLSLMAEAGMPIAMGNGCESVKERAVYVTGSNDDDGVAEAIERFFLPSVCRCCE